MQKIKVYGERNTGTNYLVALLSKNFSVDFYRSVVPGRLPLKKKEFVKDLYFNLSKGSTLGWKHGIPPIKQIEKQSQAVDLIVLTLSKNPYSFLLSLFKRPYNYKGERPKTFEDFLRTPWQVRGRDNHSAAQFETPIHLWNAKNQSYIDLKKKFPERVVTLKYEALIDDPVKVAKELGEQFGLSQKHAEIQNYEKAAKGQGKDSEKGFGYYRDYYLNELWREKLTAGDIAFVNQHLNREVAGYFGYEVL